MKVLVLGSGAKDHAIAWWFSKSKLVEALYIAPYNPGTTDFAINLPDVDPSDKDQVLQACKDNGIDFVFIGTEDPLFTGVIDHLNKHGIRTFGAPGYALKLEDDRRFSREFASRNQIPMPDYQLIENEEELSAFLDSHTDKLYIVKKNTVSPSRVMIDSSNRAALEDFSRTLLKDGPIIIEERIKGVPVTVTLLLDEAGGVALPLVSEYIKTETGDNGVATGGMGAICPIPLNKAVKDSIANKVVKPTLVAMKKENLFYKGVLTFSIMLKDNEPFLVDFHVRLNDPATQAFVPIIQNDIVDLMLAMQDNTLSKIKIQTNGKSTVSVVIASQGYPASTRTGVKVETVAPVLIKNIRNVEKPLFFFGAVEEREDGMYTTGGRVATIVGVSDNIIHANEMAYDNIDAVKFEGSWHRDDIGNKFFQAVTEAKP